MGLGAGDRLGPYEVVALLGTGGMGEVYRARDTRLNRTVAIKVLSQDLIKDANARQRLEREAQAVAALSHPHICPLFDIGHQDGTDFLVMEHLEGENLAQRLARGKLSLDQTLRHGIEIADALAAAHKSGIIHRDLKPGNIMLTKAGAKLLDFGLAKAREQVVLSGQTETTAAGPLTGHGTILGTLQYMAPEQLERKEADARSDVFALGTVLYEMITGSKAFEGKTDANIVAAILEREPVPVSTRNPTVSPVLDHVVGKCLAKDPDSRWHAARDVMLELKWVAEGSAAAVIPATISRWRRVAVWAAAFSVIVTTLAAAAWMLHRWTDVPADVEPTVFGVLPPTGTVLGQLAVAPDGRAIAFVAVAGDTPGSIYVRRRDALAIHQLPGTDGASSPFWSPDSRFIGFFARNKLRKIPASGGPAQVVCNVVGALGGTWNAEGTILFAEGDGPLKRVPASGGEPVPVTTVPTKRGLHRWPSFLPDGQHFLFSVRSDRAGEDGAYVGSLGSQSIKPVVKCDLRALYSPPDHLLFVRDRTLLAQSFDPTRLEAIGDPVVVAESVGYILNGVDAGFSVSATGVLGYETAAYAATELAWFDSAGRELARVGAPADYLFPWLETDGRQIVVERMDPNTAVHQIWKLDVTRNGNASRLTQSPMGRHMPVLSSDGHRMIYISNDSGHFDLMLKDLRQPEQEETLLSTSANKYPTDWSLDGRFVVYEALDAGTKRDLWVLPLFGDRRPHPLLQSDSNEQQGRLSPDGHWIAYISDETGRFEVYVRSFPALGDKQQVSTAGGTQPQWRGDGKAIFYLSLDHTLMAVDLGHGAGIEPAAPRTLFRVPFGTSGGVPTGVEDATRYMVSADGNRFLVNAPLEGAGPREVTVVTNWPALLRGR